MYVLGASAHVTATPAGLVTVNHHGSGPNLCPRTSPVETFGESYFSCPDQPSNLFAALDCDTHQAIRPRASWATNIYPGLHQLCTPPTFSTQEPMFSTQHCPSPPRCSVCSVTICLANPYRETSPKHLWTTIRPKMSRKYGRHLRGSRPE